MEGDRVHHDVPFGDSRHDAPDEGLDPGIAELFQRVYGQKVDVETAARHLWVLHRGATRAEPRMARARRALVPVLTATLLLATSGMAVAAIAVGSDGRLYAELELLGERFGAWPVAQETVTEVDGDGRSVAVPADPELQPADTSRDELPAPTVDSGSVPERLAEASESPSAPALAAPAPDVATPTAPAPYVPEPDPVEPVPAEPLPTQPDERQIADDTGAVTSRMPDLGALAGSLPGRSSP